MVDAAVGVGLAGAALLMTAAEAAGAFFLNEKPHLTQKLGLPCTARELMVSKSKPGQEGSVNRSDECKGVNLVAGTALATVAVRVLAGDHGRSLERRAASRAKRRRSLHFSKKKYE
jgi:hypothetical protein